MTSLIALERIKLVLSRKLQCLSMLIVVVITTQYISTHVKEKERDWTLLLTQINIGGHIFCVLVAPKFELGNFTAFRTSRQTHNNMYTYILYIYETNTVSFRWALHSSIPLHRSMTIDIDIARGVRQVRVYVYVRSLWRTISMRIYTLPGGTCVRDCVTCVYVFVRVSEDA